jgi:hypothetical protein
MSIHNYCEPADRGQVKGYADVMNEMDASSRFEGYPWAVPTQEQREWFDALSAEEKRRAILEMIEEGFASPLSIKSVEDIIRDLRGATDAG